MNDSENSLGRSIKMILGTLGIFVVFGFLALILSGFAGNESAEERAFKGEFSEETTETRWANLEEVQTAQAGAFDQAKVDEALKKIGSTAGKPAKTSIVVPGSPTFLEQSAPPADAPAETEAEKPEEESPAIEPKTPGAAAPEKDVPKPGPVNAPGEKAKPEGGGKSKGEPKPESKGEPKGEPKPEPTGEPKAEPKAEPKGEPKPKPEGDAKAEVPAQPEPAPENQ